MPETLYGYSRLSEVVKVKRPLLMLDRVRVDIVAGMATGIKAVSVNEPYFPGHFPETPIMPGVLQIAAMAQTAEALLRAGGEVAELDDLLLVGFDRLKFRKPALPGDRLEIGVERVACEEAGFSFKCVVDCGGQTVSQGNLRLALAGPLPRRDGADEFCPPLPFADQAAVGGGEESAQLIKMIPHRYPFLLIDRQLAFDRENCRNVVVKNISGGEEFFRALRRPALPAFLQAEIAAQACCALAFELPEARGKLAFFMSIDRAVFLAEVVPGDQLVICGEGNVRGRLGSSTSTLHVGSTKVAEMTVKFVLVDKS